MAGWPALRPGDEHRNVHTLQHLLNHRGAALEVDGVYGEKTEQAVRHLRAEAGLAGDGGVDGAVWHQLISDVGMGDRGDAVKAAQVQLLYRRTLPDVDGTFGIKTDTSVRRFQVFRRLPVDGRVNAGTWREMLTEDLSILAPPGEGHRDVDPSDWRARLIAKLRPGWDPSQGTPGPGFGPSEPGPGRVSGG